MRKLSTTLRAIYEGNSGDIDTAILTSVGGLLESNVLEGFGKGFADVDFSTPDAEMLTRITRNVWQFSAAKNYQQMRDMTLALKNTDGKLRTFTDFKTAASVINDRYNNVWLKTEYVSAVGGATMAARWAEFKQNADIMPYLQYSTVGDALVRDEHARLNDVVRKINDQFWQTHFPPNGWRCRCGTNQLPGSAATETQNLPDVPVAPLFRTNLAESGLVFPAGHPYYNGVPQSVLKGSLAYLPIEAAYKKITIGGGNAEIHLLHAHSNDEGFKAIKRHVEITQDLYRNGFSDAKLLPEIHEKDAKIKPNFYPKSFTPIDIKKNPDCWIKDSKGNDLVCDYKYLDGKSGRNLPAYINEGAKQAEFVVAKLSDPNSKINTFRINGKIDIIKTENNSLKGVVILKSNGDILLERWF